MPPPPDMAYWLNRKYTNLEHATEGEFQKNVAAAGLYGAQAGEVAADAASQRALQEAQGFGAQSRGQLELEMAATANKGRQLVAPELQDAAHAAAVNQNNPAFIGGGAPRSQVQEPQQQYQPQWATPPWSQQPARKPAIAPLQYPDFTKSRIGSGPGVMYRWNAQTQSPESWRKGTADVKPKGGKGGGRAPGAGKAPKGGKGGGGEPKGLEAILPALMAASQGAGAAGPQAGPAMPPPMAPGVAAPPGFAYGEGDVQPDPGYPFGAGYLFGATSVPGQGSGRVDKVPAMLAPHEAVLNRAAADMMGRGAIAALNAKGVQQMGMRRGAAT